MPPRELLVDQLVIPRGYADAAGQRIPLYPKSAYSSGRALLTALGSFWSGHFQSRGILLSKFRGSAQLAIQSYMDYVTTVAAMSHETCPLFRQRIWHALVLRESDLRYGPDSLLQYGEEALYNGAYRYGVPLADASYAFDLSPIKHAGIILNRILAPTLAWVNGSDFHFDAGTLIFQRNPFKDPRIPVRDIVDHTGKVLDREIVLWAFNSLADHAYLYQHYGWILQRKAESSDGYKQFVVGMWRSLTGGMAPRDLEWILSAMAGIPVVLEAQETVEVVVQHSNRTVVVTDQHSYFYPADSIPRYVAGNVVYAGQCLVDTVSVFDLSSYADVEKLLTSVRLTDQGVTVPLAAEMPTSSSSSAARGSGTYIGYRKPSKIFPATGYLPLVFALPVSRDLLGQGYTTGLAFQNTSGEWDLTASDATGQTVAKLGPVMGSPADVNKLWTDAHARGVASGQPWIDYHRPLPVQVNPAGFIVENFLGNNAIVVYLRQSRFAAGAPGSAWMEDIRRVLPPEKTLLTLMESDAADTMSEASDEVVAITARAMSDIAGVEVIDDEPQVFFPSTCV